MDRSCSDVLKRPARAETWNAARAADDKVREGAVARLILRFDDRVLKDYSWA